MNYDDFFRQATGHGDGPYDHQRRLAEESWHNLVDVPTGLGKTAAVVLAWLYKRLIKRDHETPTRLAYCLPMRVLVEQTRDNVQQWLKNLGLDNEVGVFVLMGGEQTDDWDIYPEQNAVLIGTQDMLISRALNRGYGMSRYRWPMHFGLLNNDCLWVFDEVQLMGSGLATTAQLAAFRNQLGESLGGQSSVRSLWMSATLDRSWLKTVDFDINALGAPLSLSVQDKQRSLTFKAAKPLKKISSMMGDHQGLAGEIIKAHQPGSRTLVMANIVQRAKDIYRELEKSKERKARLILIHSRFRPDERREKVRRLLEDVASDGIIIVSTQVVEAGVDVSARTLFTELAPWASLVQRFGRCNRRGEYSVDRPAQVFWIDLPDDEKAAIKLAAPYAPDDLVAARELLGRCTNGVGPAALEQIQAKLPFTHTHVIRRKDLVELFDTTPDLAGNDIDIDRYVRDADSSDVHVFWRDVKRARPADDEPLPAREELCPVPIRDFKDFVETLGKGKLYAYRRNFLDRMWEKVRTNEIYPGQCYMLDCAVGGYNLEHGWTGEPAKHESQHVRSLRDQTPAATANADDGTDADPYSQMNRWQTLTEHSNAICAELANLLDALRVNDMMRDTLITAARWHDLGKAHWVFRHGLPDGIPDPFVPWAKAPGKWKRYPRKLFRHELASALAVLQERNGLIPEEQRSLIAYLVAAHHGKVRLSIRSMPNEKKPSDPEVRFARGVWDGDELPQTDLGGGIIAPAVSLSLEPMELGLSAKGEPSWAERMLALRDHPALGPFRIAYLEALVRAADMRVSRRVTENNS